MKTDNVLMTIAVIALVVSVVGMGITYNYFAEFEEWITGYGVVGNINLTVETLAAINFSATNISFGSGQVDAGQSSAGLVSSNGSISNGNWTAVTNGMIIENVGNLNVTLNITAGSNAATFIGGISGGGPVYEWNITNGDGEANSCNGTTGLTLGAFETVSTDTRAVCDAFNFQDAQDTIRIDVYLVIPDDATIGERTDVITATFYVAN